MNDKKKAMTKTEIISALSDSTGLSKQQVSRFFDELVKMIGENLSESGPGVFNVPGLMKVRVIRKPATPERTGINPFTKQEQVFAAKPARNVVKISALKRLKEIV
jgi:nucleoid DNA-binding protein